MSGTPLIQKKSLFPILDIIFRIAFGGLWIVAGALKTLDYTKFQASIHSFKMLPWQAEWFLARSLPWFEIVLGIIIVFKIRQLYRPAVMTGILLLSGFIIAAAIAKFRGLRIICGCLGPSSLETPTNYVILFARNFLLVGIGLFLWKMSRAEPHYLVADAAPDEAESSA